MEDNVIILTGAGFSNIIGLPVTKEFNSVIDSSNRFELDSILKRLLDDNYYDIEHVMSSLEQFIDKKATSIERILLDNEDLLPTAHSQVRPRLGTIRTNAERYLTFIKSELYKILEKFDSKESAELYLNVVTECSQQFDGSRINVFTTNYDLSFEKSLISNSERFKELGISDVDYGFKQKYGTLVADFGFDGFSKDRIGYYKIHGSLDWHYDEHFGCTKSGTNAQPSNPNIMPILYPGFKGVPSNVHFKKIHDLFYKNLQKASVVVVIGFAFRDPYINDLIKYAKMLNEKLTIHYFNPLKVEQLPKESGVREFIEFFGVDFTYHNLKVENSKKPFGSNWHNP